MMNVQGFSRSGIRIVNDAKVSPLMKDAFLAYARWLRKNYDFPQRVVVYVKHSNSIKTANDGEVAATFFAPFDKSDEPYIKIAAGDFKELKMKVGVFQAIFSTLNSLSHELQHYYQWLDDDEFDEQVAIDGAEELTYEYLDSYKENFLAQRFSCGKLPK